jgi:hypothetical protein
MMSTIGAWNIRGGHNIIKLDQCKHLIASNNLSILAVLETKLNLPLTLKAAEYINKEWKLIHNLSNSPFGRIMILFNPLHIYLTSLLSTDQMIHCHARDINDNSSYYITFVYAANSANARKTLHAVIPSLRQNTHPWLIIGDFNCCLNLSDRVGGNPLTPNEIQPLNSTLMEADLIPVNSVGMQYTWNNKRRNGVRTFSRIDHSFSNHKALLQWPLLYNFLPPPILSDHSPQIIHLRVMDMRRKSNFKFFNSWVLEPDFEQIVANVWNKSKRGNSMFVLQEKLKDLKAVLKQWAYNKYGKGNGLSASILLKLGEAQKAMMNDVNNSQLSEAEAALSKQYYEALTVEKEMMRQKSRIKWWDKGDRNSAYFHACLKNNQSKENLITVVDKDEVHHSSSDGVQQAFENYFKSLLGNSNNFKPDIESIPSKVLPKLEQNEYNYLCSEVTTAEIHDAMFSLKTNSCGGPDGMNACFYTACWPIVADDVCKAICLFFNKSKLYRSYNYTNIALVPKIKNALHVKDYRPISCCNTIYKCISKIIASRLRLVLPTIISSNQAAFLPGRSILDNILLAHELFKGYNNKNSAPKAMMKLDIMKAFDMLQWDSIVRIMGFMNFPPHFVAWVYECMSTPTYSININGVMKGFFGSKQGIRQGDPLSAFIFILVMELLTRMINDAIQLKKIKLHPKCAAPLISTLMFADDLVLFCAPELDTVQEIMNTLNHFYTMTGLKVNIQKSSISVAGVSVQQISQLVSISGLTLSLSTDSYLGLPLSSSKITTTQCLPLYQRITARMNLWTTRKLSQAGRLTLIKSIIFAMQVYWARMFVLPFKLIKMIRSAIMKFFWTGKTMGRYLAPIKFNSLEAPLNKGGLGLFNLKQWNKTAFARHIDTYFNNTASMWTTWSEINVIKGKNLWSMNKPQNLSWTWQCIFKLKDTILPLIQMNTDPIYKTSFWEDPWLDKGYILKRNLSYNEIMQSGIHLSAKVMDVLYIFQGGGRYSSNQRVQNIWDKIKNFTPMRPTSDRIVWGEKNNVFKVGEVYERIQCNSDILIWPWWKTVWSKDSSMRHNMILWKVLKDALLTRDKLASKGMSIAVMCPFCGIYEETAKHLFFNCDIVLNSWNEIMACIDGDTPSPDSNVEWNRIQTKTKGKNQRKRIFTVALKSFIYAVWNERNIRIFDSSKSKSVVSFNHWIRHEVKSSLDMLFFHDPGIEMCMHF